MSFPAAGSTVQTDRRTPVPTAELRFSTGCPNKNPHKSLWSTFFCTFTYMGWYFWTTWWEKGILEMKTLQQITFLFSIRMSNYTLESCFGKERLNIVLHKENAGITFHKTSTLKYSKHPCICYIKIMPSFFFLILAQWQYQFLTIPFL